MEIVETALRDVKLIRPRMHGDERGWFTEVFNAERFAAAGLPSAFVQDNQSFSRRGVLRGLHYQLGQPQGKMVRAISGHIWDVAVDVRRESPEFGRWAGFDLRPLNEAGQLEMLWIPEGYAHGFVVLSETAEVLYKTTRGYYPQGERSILWDDPQLAIQWPLEKLAGDPPELSAKDLKGSPFATAEVY